VNGRLILNREWTDESATDAMIFALSDAIAAVARAEKAP